MTSASDAPATRRSSRSILVSFLPIARPRSAAPSRSTTSRSRCLMGGAATSNSSGCFLLRRPGLSRPRRLRRGRGARPPSPAPARPRPPPDPRLRAEPHGARPRVGQRASGLLRCRHRRTTGRVSAALLSRAIGGRRACARTRAGSEFSGPDDSLQLNYGKRLAAVNYSDHQSQCYAILPWGDLRGGTWRLSDRIGPAACDRDGNALAERGVYLDMPRWGHQVFDIDLARERLRRGPPREDRGGPPSVIDGR